MRPLTARYHHWVRNTLIGVGVMAMASIGDAGLAPVRIEPKSRMRPSSAAEILAVAPTRHSRGLVKRALFGLVLLVTLVAGGACLLHASIEADGEPTSRSYSDVAGPIGTAS
jgi:hypothetical protein